MTIPSFKFYYPPYTIPGTPQLEANGKVFVAGTSPNNRIIHTNHNNAENPQCQERKSSNVKKYFFHFANPAIYPQWVSKSLDPFYKDMLNTKVIYYSKGHEDVERGTVAHCIA